MHSNKTKLNVSVFSGAGGGGGMKVKRGDERMNKWTVNKKGALHRPNLDSAFEGLEKEF